MIPTTKAKQRAFLDTLIHLIDTNQITKVEILAALRRLRKQLHNRSAMRGRTTAPPTRTQIGRIKRLHVRKPEFSMQEISQQLAISIGRVSEVLRGKRL